MRIPNKFNGYMSDGRRLYPDPATSAIIAASLAKGTAVAAPTLAATTAVAAPTLAAAATPLATTAATNLGTTAALEASKQGIIQAGAQQAGAEAAKQAGVEAAKQVAQEGAKQAGAETLKTGIMQGADDVAAMNMNQVSALNPAQTVTEESIKAGLNNVQNLSANLNPSGARTLSDAGSLHGTPNIVPRPSGLSLEQMANNMPSVTNTPVAPPVSNVPTGLQSATTPSPVNPGYEASAAQGRNATTIAKDAETAANVNKQWEATQAAEKYANMNPLEKGMFKAKELAGDIGQFTKDNQLLTTGGIMLAQNLMQPSYNTPAKKKYSRSGESNFKYSEPSTGDYTPIFEPTPYAVGGPVEQMSAQNAIGGNMMYPQSQLQTPMYSNPMVSRPMPNNIINSGIDAPTQSYTGEPRMAVGGKVSAFEKMMKEEETRKKKADAQAEADLEKGQSIASKTKPYSRTQSTNSPYAAAVKELQGLGKKYGIQMAAPAKTNVDLMGDQDQIEYAANGGIMHGLGGYSDGGRLLKGPGDGVSDSIPAVIGNKQPARLADGEFVIPARIVSELGNGSTEAGARKLYAMMERIQKQRGKTVGKGKVAVNSKASKHLPA